MARMLGAAWHPVRNFTAGGQTSVRGVVVHIMDGTLSGTEAWFNDADAQASSHFGTGRAGALVQFVDTGNRAWAQAGGNSSWLSVENEGKGGDVLTDAQLDSNAEVLAWAHMVYGVPLRVASGPSGSGLGYHAMGGTAWGGHPSCPGPRIVAQLPEIVARAERLGAKEDEMQLTDNIKLGEWVSARWPKDAGLKDGKVEVNTAIGSGYAHARKAAENSDAILGELKGLSTAVAALTAALTAKH